MGQRRPLQRPHRTDRQQHRFKAPVFNYSADFPFLWDEVTIPVRYGSDRKLTKALLLTAATDLTTEFAHASRDSWADAVKKFRLEDASVDPLVTLVANDNWMELTVRSSSTRPAALSMELACCFVGRDDAAGEIAMKKLTRPAPAQVSPLKLGRVLQFMQVLWGVHHGLQSTSKRMQARYGVTGLQRMVIRIVGRAPGISAGTVAEVLHIDKSTLTGALARLVDSGAIVRDVDPEDGRRARLSLGPQGRAIDAVKAGTVEAAVQRALARMPEAKIKAANLVLSAIAEELERGD